MQIVSCGDNLHEPSNMITNQISFKKINIIGCKIWNSKVWVNCSEAKIYIDDNNKFQLLVVQDNL